MRARWVGGGAPPRPQGRGGQPGRPCTPGSPLPSALLPSLPPTAHPPNPRKKTCLCNSNGRFQSSRLSLNHHGDQGGGEGRIELSCFPKTGAMSLTSWPLALRGVAPLPGLEARFPGPQPPCGGGGAWRDGEEEGGSDFQNWHRDRAGLAGGR